MTTITRTTGFETNQMDPQTNLHELISQLISTFISKASANRSFFVNDVRAGLTVAANLQMLAAVLSGLLSAVITHAKDSCIRLSAKTYGNVVLVQLNESASSDTGAIENEISKLQPIAEKMFGSVSVTSLRKDLATISFGFVNLPLLE